MWEVQHLLDTAFPAAVGATTAGAFYYLTDRILHRRHEATELTLRNFEHDRMVEGGRAADELRDAMQALTEELKQQRLASPSSTAIRVKFDPESTLQKLKLYRERDPDLNHAIARFVDAEATQDDPVEGVSFEQDVSPSGPTQRKIREMLSA